MKDASVSPSVIKRLPRYYRFLGELKAAGVTRISSGELSRRMGLTASQIRQDFNCFGGFGQQGYGYNVAQLEGEIGKILGLQPLQKMILIGAGRMGRAVVMHTALEQRGFSLTAIFDKKESLTGQIVRGLPIRHVSVLEEYCQENRPAAAILCIPKSEAHDMAVLLISLGVKGFWNFSHYDLAAAFPGIPCENVHLGDSLMSLCYQLHDKHTRSSQNET